MTKKLPHEKAASRRMKAKAGFTRSIASQHGFFDLQALGADDLEIGFITAIERGETAGDTPLVDAASSSLPLASPAEVSSETINVPVRANRSFG